MLDTFAVTTPPASTATVECPRDSAESPPRHLLRGAGLLRCTFRISPEAGGSLQLNSGTPIKITRGVDTVRILYNW